MEKYLMSSPTQLSLPMDDDKNDFGSPVYDDLDFAADLPEFYYDHTLSLDPSPARAERSPARFHSKHFSVDGQKHFDNNDSNNDADKYKYDADKYKYDAKPERVADQLSAPFALNSGSRFNFSHSRNVSLDDSSYRRQNALYSHRPSASISADPPSGLFPHSHSAATLHSTSSVPALSSSASNASLLDSPYSAATPARRRKSASISSLTTSLSPARVGKTPLKSHRRTRSRIDHASPGETPLATPARAPPQFFTPAPPIEDQDDDACKQLRRARTASNVDLLSPALVGRSSALKSYPASIDLAAITHSPRAEPSVFHYDRENPYRDPYPYEPIPESRSTEDARLELTSQLNSQLTQLTQLNSLNSQALNSQALNSQALNSQALNSSRYEAMDSRLHDSRPTEPRFDRLDSRPEYPPSRSLSSVPSTSSVHSVGSHPSGLASLPSGSASSASVSAAVYPSASQIHQTAATEEIAKFAESILNSDTKRPIVVQHDADTDPRKKHKCPLCLARFQRPEHVKRHLKSHSTEKPFQCDMPDCGRRFNRKDNLKAHLKKIHGKHT
ncbi:hypothetical protein E0198_004124 [Clavispora lusitaniae]|nr:hypothetical protein E0198_004124 [Clavispora lusitaniae]